MIGEQIILFLRNKITYNINRLYWLLGYLAFVETASSCGNSFSIEKCIFNLVLALKYISVVVIIRHRR